jgi:hypothetical protein
MLSSIIDVLAKNRWVVERMVKIIGEFEASFKKYPPIKVGTLDPYVPPKNGRSQEKNGRRLRCGRSIRSAPPRQQ